MLYLMKNDRSENWRLHFPIFSFSENAPVLHIVLTQMKLLIVSLLYFFFFSWYLTKKQQGLQNIMFDQKIFPMYGLIKYCIGINKLISCKRSFNSTSTQQHLIGKIHNFHALYWLRVWNNQLSETRKYKI